MTNELLEEVITLIESAKKDTDYAKGYHAGIIAVAQLILIHVIQEFEQGE